MKTSQAVTAYPGILRDFKFRHPVSEGMFLSENGGNGRWVSFSGIPPILMLPTSMRTLKELFDVGLEGHPWVLAGHPNKP